MSERFNRYKAWLIPAIVGALSPYVLINAWGGIVGVAWIPIVRYLTDKHGMAVRSALDLAWLFDGLFGILCGGGIALLVSLLVRVRPMRSWLILMSSFLVAAFIPDALDVDPDMFRFFIWQPLVIAFAAATLLAFWLRRGSYQHGIAP
jgi:hypothetical protein